MAQTIEAFKPENMQKQKDKNFNKRTYKQKEMYIFELIWSWHWKDYNITRSNWSFILTPKQDNSLDFYL